jgi:4-diphosphocytidyl-2-C-methyl-D-erythritol kinase
VEPLVLFSPAKVNLFFRVLHKREDGYHAIASLYQALSLGDTLRISLANEDRLTCDAADIPCDERNLVSKALRVFRAKTGCAFSVHVHIEKKIPVQAGLGGGSSNAASALFAFNALTGAAVDEKTLSSWAAEFSSDASFFFSTGTAYCTGRGEQLEDLPSLEARTLWLAKPQEGLSTPLVYAHCSPSSYAQRDPRAFLQRALEGDLETFNDLESPAFSLMPSLSVLKKELFDLGFSQVTMTGSGTAFMCFGPVAAPFLPGVRFFPVRFSQRVNRKWYEFPHLLNK